MASLRPLVAGNWKMNGLMASLAEIATIDDALGKGVAGRAECAVCPPFTLIAPAAQQRKGGRLMIGGQDCHTAPAGAFTGDVSAEMLKDAGASLVIVGHSERRSTHGETDDLVRAKAEAAMRAGLHAIVCVGETRAERDGGETLRVIGRQIDESVPPRSTAETVTIAYEPVWAIGTGLVPTAENVAEVHGFVRRRLAALLGPDGEKLRILYGGSVKPANARDIVAVPDVDGLLVGGASLTASEFLGILAAYG